MKRTYTFSIVATTLFLAISCASPNANQHEESWQALFNGKDLAGWDTYIGAEHEGQVLGLNNDPLKVFTVTEIDGEPAMRISGQQFGGISTVSEFENFHLQLQFKWGEQKWAPRENSKRDSGILYFAGGPHGVDAKAWMRSQEFQVQEGDCGDYWGVAGGAFEIPVIKNGENYIYDPSGELMPFSTISEFGRHAVKSPDAEKPTGEWNTVDIFCLNGSAIHMINGQVVMILYNSSVVEGDSLRPLTKGKIQLQSEGAEVFYRNIRIEGISELPKDISTTRP